MSSLSARCPINAEMPNDATKTIDEASFSIPALRAVDIDIDLDNETNNFEITDCFTKIENYQSIVYGFNIHATCYVDKSMLLLREGKSKTISRCGEWIQMVGPSQQQVLCMLLSQQLH